MQNKTWTVKSPIRLDAFLRQNIPSLLNEDASGEVSNSKIRRLIIAGAVSVNGKQIRIPGYDLHAGSRVSAVIDENKFFFEKQPDDIDFVLEEKNVLFEDESIIVVNKPAFFPSEETMVKGRRNMHQAVIDYLWKKNPSLRNPPYVGIMHRLDRETSGVLLFTKTRAVNAAVHDMFENHTAIKTYRAVCTKSSSVKTQPQEKKFTVDNFIGRISPKSQACRIGVLSQQKGGQHAVTDFTISSEKDGIYYFDCVLHTGRTHQIRVHLSSSGYPIIGDQLYGGRKGFDELNGRIMLHARSLEFPHPVSGIIIKVEAPFPLLFNPQK